uniref:Uncharacterized protein n=1 Tax=Glossina austeni TaxID=7395 RepID=A0A1A9UIG6_GLOAU
MINYSVLTLCQSNDGKEVFYFDTNTIKLLRQCAIEISELLDKKLRRGKLRSELLRFEAILEGPSSCWLIPPLPPPSPPPLPLCVPKEDISYSSPKDFCNNFSNRITREGLVVTNWQLSSRSLFNPMKEKVHG